MLNQECGQLKEECARLREQHAELCSKIETGEGAKAALESLQQENTIVKKSLDEAQAESRELSKQNHELSFNLKKVTGDLAELHLTLETGRKECESLKAGIEKVRQEKVCGTGFKFGVVFP